MSAAPIDSATLNAMQEWTGGEPEEHVLGYRLPGGRPATGATMARPGQVRDEAGSSRAQEGAGMADAQYRKLSRRMDAMYESQSRFAQELTLALGTAFKGLGADIQWPIFVRTLHIRLLILHPLRVMMMISPSRYTLCSSLLPSLGTVKILSLGWYLRNIFVCVSCSCIFMIV